MHPMMRCAFATIHLPGMLALRSSCSQPSPMPLLPPLDVTNNKKLAASTSMQRCASSFRDDAEFNYNGSGDGWLVDKEMVILRRRIQEMEAMEHGWEPPKEWDAWEKEEPPEEWAAWEKEWSTTYNSNVSWLLSVLQAFLVSSRPGVGMGLIAVLMSCSRCRPSPLSSSPSSLMFHGRSSPVYAIDDGTENSGA